MKNKNMILLSVMLLLILVFQVAQARAFVNEVSKGAVNEYIVFIDKTSAAEDITETYSDSYALAANPTGRNEQKVASQTKQIVQTVEETDFPIPAASAAREWALINLISMITVAFISLVMAVTFFCIDEEEEESGKENSQKNWSKFLGIIPAAVSIIAFSLTEDMNTLMVFTDKWTAFMVIIVLIDMALAYLSRNRKTEEIT